MEQISFKTQKEKIRSFNNGFLAAHLINVGVHTGVLEALNEAKEGITVPELATKLALHEPYLKIWCQTAYFLEILDCDTQGRFKYQPFMDELLGNMGSLRNVATRFAGLIHTSGERLKTTPEYYETGDVIKGYTAERAKYVSTGTKNLHKNIDVVFSSVRKQVKIKKLLREGIDFLDIGCGSGGLIIKLAQKYSNSRFVGIDPVPYAIEVAQERTSQLGLENQVSFKCLGGENLTYNNKFDVVCLLLTFHEILPEVRYRVMDNVFQALKENGCLLLIAFAYPEKIEDFRNLNYEKGILDQFKEACTGTVILNEQEQNTLLTKIGFNNIQRGMIEGIDLITAIK